MPGEEPTDHDDLRSDLHDEYMKVSKQRYDRDDKAATLVCAILATGGSLLIATWGSGVLGSGLPRLAYAAGLFLVSWMTLLIGLFVAMDWVMSRGE